MKEKNPYDSLEIYAKTLTVNLVWHYGANSIVSHGHSQCFCFPEDVLKILLLPEAADPGTHRHHLYLPTPPCSQTDAPPNNTGILLYLNC